MTDWGDQQTTFSFIEQEFGRLDILINNACISAEALGDVEDQHWYGAGIASTI